MIIIKNLLRLYINNLTKEDLLKYINKNYKNINDNEIEIIFYYIKNKWEDIFNDDPNTWAELKNELNITTYQEIKKLYNQYSYLK